MIFDDSDNMKNGSGIQFAGWSEAFNCLEVGISIISPDLQLEYVNDAYRKIIGIPNEIGPGTSARDLYIYLAARGDFGDGDPLALAGEKLEALASENWQDALQVLSDGKVVKIRRTTTNEGFILTTITDISNARKSEALVSTVLNATDQAIIVVNADGYVDQVNTAFIELFDLQDSMEPDAHTYQSMMVNAWRSGKFVGDFFGDEVNSISEEKFKKRCLKFAELALTQPLTIRLKSGTYARFSSRKMDNNYRIFTYTDITDGIDRARTLNKAKKFSENALTDFTIAMDNMDVGYLLLDEELNTLIINQAYHSIWDSSPGTVPVGCNFRHILDQSRQNNNVTVDDAEWEEYAKFCLDELKTGNIQSRDVELSNGKQLVFSCVNLSDGKRLASFSDVSEFRAREAALKQAQLRAELADRSKSEFLANMSHEIRTPMNGVMGMAELLSNTDLNSKQKTFTDIILSSSNALLTIINDILDFSKIEAGKLELDPAPFNLRDSIEDVVALISSSIIEKDLELIVRVQPDLMNHVIGDVGRFRQILTNLLGNAAKFTEKGHVLVNLSGKQTKAGVELECFVQDTGIGIPENQVGSVFEKFSQVDGSSTRRHEGTGLGLAIASRLVGMMSGKIGCTSIQGEGSTFWFTAILQPDQEAKVEILLPYDVTSARILAIDDNSVNRSILLEQFAAWNLNGEAARSGIDGLTSLRQATRENNAFGAVVLDYHMPDMNGLEVARLIRNDKMLCQTPIIMLTSVDNIGESEAFRDLNINAHLTKPARASQLLENIIDVLRTKGNFSSIPVEIAENTPHDQAPTDGQIITHPIDTSNVIVNADNTPEIDDNQSVSSLVSTDAVVDDELHIDSRAEPEAQPEPITNTQDEGVRILVVEDNDVNQIVFTQILQHLNYSFEMVSNGKLAVEAAKRLHPQLILMDVSMPVMNGLEATKEIRANFNGSESHHKYRPIIIGITAHAMKEDRNSCLAAGMDDYLPKPISPDLLMEKIRQWMPEDSFGFLNQIDRRT